MKKFAFSFASVLLIFLSVQGLQAQDALREGKIAFAKRNYSQAITLLQAAKKARPSDGEAYYYTALVYERTGKKGAALSEYRRATELQLAPELKEKAFWKLVLHYRHVQDWDNLYSVSQRFLAFRPNREVEKFRDQAEANLNPARKRIQRLIAEGEADEKRGQLSQAAAHYAEAARLDPDNIKILWRAGDAYRKLDRCRDALPYYKKAIAADDESWYSHFQAGVCQYGLREFDDALVSFAKAEKRNDRPDETFKFYLNTGRGLAHLELEQIDEAERALSILKSNRKLFEKSAPASILAAMLALLKNDRASIDPYLNRIGKTDPDRPAVPLLRSIRAVNVGDYAEAEKQMDELFLENEKRGNRFNHYVAQALVLIAHHHYLNGRNEKALQALARYRSLEVDETASKGVLYRLSSANPVTPFKEGQSTLAQKYSAGLRILAAHPTQAAAIIEGRVLFEEDEREQAWSALNKAQGDPLCRFYLAELQRERGDARLARETLKSALREDDTLVQKLQEFKELDEIWRTPEPVPETKP